MATILMTGGAGFIGSHAVRHWVTRFPEHQIVNLDALTYAGNLANLDDLRGAANYTFVKGDICDREFVASLFETHQVQHVIHMAAESHVDRSIQGPLAFVRTNIEGTLNLLEAARGRGEDFGRFYHISTDEVYGSLGPVGAFTESTSYDPRSPYSASKASSDHLVRAYFHTFGLDVVISNCSNNYGPFQFPEKLIPLMIRNMQLGQPLPVYGKGDNIRDWIWVGDHVTAMEHVFEKGQSGETYNLGGQQECTNLDLVHRLCDIVDDALRRPQGTSRALITFVTDRPGHDKRYAIDPTKAREELGWEATVKLEEGLRQTVQWYLQNAVWLKSVTSGTYRDYYAKQYGG
ncbi:MAG: dTDP-glucose 4,6-dehydratase [Flavobacteriales bacterium]